MLRRKTVTLAWQHAREHQIQSSKAVLARCRSQQELGTEGLAEEDKYLMEINLDELETTSGEKQEYWLLAIRAARMATTLWNNSERVAATATEDHNT